MQNKDQQKKRTLKIILTDFSINEKAITRYTRIYIYIYIYIYNQMAGITQNSKKVYFHCGPSAKTVEI